MVGEERTLAAEQFLAVAQGEARHQKLGRAPRRIVGVNTVNSRLDYLMMNNIGCAKTPFSTRLRHGFLLLDVVSKQNQNWTSEMSAGRIGVRRGDSIATATNEAGPLAYGPYRTLWPGDYLATIRMAIDRPSHPNFGDEEWRTVTIELVLSEVVQQTFHVTLETVGDRIYNFPFTISNKDILKMIQIRFSSYGIAPVILRSIEVQSTDQGLPPDENSIRLLPGALLRRVASQRQNWTRSMSVGRAGVREGDAIASKPNKVGDFAFGPYLTLSPGKYRARVRVTIVRPRRLYIWRWRQRRRRAFSIELVLDETVRQMFDFTLNNVGRHTFNFKFVISEEDAEKQIQIRLKSYGVTPIVLRSIDVERIDGSGRWLKPWLPMRIRLS
jgi:hypothetical protein